MWSSSLLLRARSQIPEFTRSELNVLTRKSRKCTYIHKSYAKAKTKGSLILVLVWIHDTFYLLLITAYARLPMTKGLTGYRRLTKYGTKSQRQNGL